MLVDAATEPFVLLLLAAGIGAILLGEVRDGLLVLLGLLPIVVADVVTGYRGERALEALREASAPVARVRRDGAVLEVSGGQRSCRATSCCSAAATSSPPTCASIRVDRLLVDRSILTGESVPESGAVEPDPASAPLAERHALAYAGTSVVGGRGEGIVVATGAATEVGRIAGGLGPRGRRRSPLQARAGPPRPDPPRRRDRADRHRHGPRVRPRPDGRREPARRHLRGDRGDPRGAADPARGHPRPRRVPAPQARRPRPAAERRGDPRRDRPDRHRQDRHADPEPAGGRLGPDAGGPVDDPDRRLAILLDALRAEDDAWATARARSRARSRGR